VAPVSEIVFTRLLNRSVRPVLGVIVTTPAASYKRKLVEVIVLVDVLVISMHQDIVEHTLSSDMEIYLANNLGFSGTKGKTPPSLSLDFSMCYVSAMTELYV